MSEWEKEIEPLIEGRRVEMIETITNLLYKASFEKVDVVYRIMVDL